MEPKIILIIVGALVAFGAVAFVVLAPSGKDKAAKRAAGLSNGGGMATGKTSSNGGGNNGQDTSKERRKQVQDSLKKIEEKSAEQKKKQRLTLPQKIEQAGLSITPVHFYIASIISLITMAIVGFVTGQKLSVVGLMAIVGGLGLPNFVLGYLRKRRQKKFITEFTNAVEVIVRGVRSGLPVNECLKIIARDAQEPVKNEFYMMTEGLRVGLSMEQTLDRMYDRMPLNEVRFFAIVLLIQQQTGGNLGEALGNLAAVLRGRKMMEGKVAALSMEAKASAYILCSLPFAVGLLVHLSAPEYLAPMFTTKEGNMWLMIGGVWMTIGAGIMKKMIAIKV